MIENNIYKGVFLFDPLIMNAIYYLLAKLLPFPNSYKSK